MDIKEFIKNFIDQFDEVPEIEVASDTVFRDLDGWSSMVALSVMAMIDDEYDVQIKADEMRNACTIQQLFDCVKSYL